MCVDSESDEEVKVSEQVLAERATVQRFIDAQGVDDAVSYYELLLAGLHQTDIGIVSPFGGRGIQCPGNQVMHSHYSEK